MSEQQEVQSQTVQKADEQKPLLQQAKESEGAKKLVEFDLNKVSQKQRIASKIRPETTIVVQMEEVTVGDEKESFAIRKLAYRDSSRIDAKRYRKKPNGQIEFSTEYAETIGNAWQIHECVLANENEGSDLPPKWVKMYTLEEILGTGKEDEKDAESLMGNPNPDGEEFVYSLLAAIWRVNPTLSPLNREMGSTMIGAG